MNISTHTYTQMAKSSKKSQKTRKPGKESEEEKEEKEVKKSDEKKKAKKKAKAKKSDKKVKKASIDESDEKSRETEIDESESKKSPKKKAKKKAKKEAEEAKSEEKKIDVEDLPDFDEEKQCPICIEVYTWSGAHKRIACQYCNYAACRECMQTILVDPEARKDPECPAPTCRRAWTKEFIHSSFTKTFQFGDLKRHREQVLFDRERSLLPATQTILEALENRHKQEKALIEEENRLREEANRIKDRLRDLRYQRLALAHEDGTNLNMETVEHKTFIRPCPAAGCRGYLSTRWKCPICEIWVCKDCHAIKKSEDDDRHRCKDDDLKTAELIMKETKPCPKCGTRIFKNGGCPQMWCTNCHTGFSWSTGRIVTGPVHNPHYFEWMRQNGNAQQPTPQDALRNDGCGEINIHRISMHGHRTCGHVNWYEIVRFINEVADDLTRYPTENANTYLPLRLSFLKGDIDETQFKRSLQMKEKRLSKLREEKEVLQTFVTVAREEMIQISGLKVNSNDVLAAYNRILDLRVYINSQLVKLGSRYNNNCSAISSEGWNWSDTNTLQGKKVSKKKQREIPDDELEHDDEMMDAM